MKFPHPSIQVMEGKKVLREGLQNPVTLKINGNEQKRKDYDIIRLAMETARVDGQSEYIRTSASLPRTEWWENTHTTAIMSLCAIVFGRGLQTDVFTTRALS